MQHIEDLIKKPCYALYAHEGWVEGVESLSGKIFTLTGFQRRRIPKKTWPTPLEFHKAQLKNDVTTLTRLLQEAREKLDDIGHTHCDWDEIR